jgi:adenine C2-methylase RlmN of 23S rRNA A2503 and tRNA A37
MLSAKIVEVYKNKEEDVFKYMHLNGVENCLKISKNCTYSAVVKENNKAVLFVSSSYGCQQGCKFCYLTSKKIGYKRICYSEISQMIKNILLEQKNEIKDKYLKISFMGMGDVLSENFGLCFLIDDILKFVIENNICLGLDGIDIGTSFPKGVDKEYFKYLEEINKFLHNFYIENDKIKLNPRNKYSFDKKHDNESRTIVRLFVSLHSVDDSIRKLLMPKSESLDNIVKKLQFFNLDIIFHCIFFKGVNDKPHQCMNLEIFLLDNFKDSELRLLRFNKCDSIKEDLNESEKVDDIIKYFSASNLKFKYQISTGAEIKAACGQFICKK